jgi:hypothetical protein
MFTAVVVQLFCLFMTVDFATAEQRRTKNLILITLDGLRWQELFGGADQRLMTKATGGVRDVESLKRRFWADDNAERREQLLPYFWRTIAKEGQVLGDISVDCHVRVTNGRYFSYPGYSEILCGFPDSKINSNAKRYNKNITVLEWLHRRPEYKGRVAAFTSWDVFPYIINDKRSGIYVNAGWRELEFFADKQREVEWNELARTLPKYWPGVRYDVFTSAGALEYLKTQRPRVLYVALGETDDWAHDGRYDLYLDAANRSDRIIQDLWETAQSLESHRNCTSMVITTDHGRGDDREGWKSHGILQAGSDHIWIAVLGPDTPALGIRRNMEVTQSQVAATVAQLLGEDYSAVNTQIGSPLPGVVRQLENTKRE